MVLDLIICLIVDDDDPDETDDANKPTIQIYHVWLIIFQLFFFFISNKLQHLGQLKLK